MHIDGRHVARRHGPSGSARTAWMDGKGIALKDEKGGTSHVTQADVFQSNGVIHVIDAVVMPN